MNHPVFGIGLTHGLEWIYILIFGFGGAIFWFAALVSCVTKESESGNAKVVWLLLIIFLGLFGALGYFLIRRPQRISELGR